MKELLSLRRILVVLAIRFFWGLCGEILEGRFCGGRGGGDGRGLGEGGGGVGGVGCLEGLWVGMGRAYLVFCYKRDIF